jgi:uncharacterized protein YndB with AHSA1/START domain
MWFDAEPVPLSFTEESPHHLTFEASIRASPERVFDVFATGEGQEGWFQDFVACRWTSGEPHTVGTTREIELKLLTVKERFLAWNRGKRLTFHIYAISLPLVKAMVEDMQFSAAGDGKTKLVWRVHYKPSLVFSLAHPVARKVFGKMFAASLTGLARYVESHP